MHDDIAGFYFFILFFIFNQFKITVGLSIVNDGIIIYKSCLVEWRLLV